MRCTVLLLCLISAPAAASFVSAGSGQRAALLPIVLREAALRGVPPALADAVAMVETGYHPDAVGSSGEIGLMQVMPATARQLGFIGTLADLADPATNIRLGVAYLARAWQASGGDVCRALMKYRAGLGEEFMTPLSVSYCARARGWLAGNGSDLVGPGSDLASPAAVAAPGPETADPYVIVMAPALGGRGGVRPIYVAAHAPSLPVSQHRSLAERNTALQARVESHVRRISPAMAANAAAAVALALTGE